MVRSVTVPGSTFDVRPASGGVSVLWARGRTGDLRLSGGRWPGGARSFAARPAVRAPSGPAVLSGRFAYVARKAFPRGQRTIAVTAIDTTSGRSRTTVVARPPSPTTELRIHASGGAVAVSYLEGERPRDQRLRWVVKPPGTATFRQPRVIEGPRDPYDYRYELALGPDGSGALLTGPVLADAPGVPLRVRRLSRQGAPGPWAQLGGAGYRGSTLSLALSARGTVAIAVAAEGVGGDVDPLPGHTQLLASSLPAESSTPTPLQLLADLGSDGFVSGEETRVVIGAGDVTVVSSASSFPDAVLAFRGPPHALSPAARLPVREPSGVVPAVARDGGAFLVWTPAQPGEWKAPPVMAASLPPGDRSFGRSTVVARSRIPKGFYAIAPHHLVPLGRSRAVLGFSDASLDDVHYRLAELRR